MHGHILKPLIGDRSIVGGVGGDDAIRVHHVLTAQIGLTHFSQAEWRREATHKHTHRVTRDILCS